MILDKTRPKMVTVEQVISFLESIFPRRARDVAFLYHAPYKRIDHSSTKNSSGSSSNTIQSQHQDCSFRIPEDLSTLTARCLIISITPTAGVYAATHRSTRQPKSQAVVFLHRPFDLDRRQIRLGTTVVSSHVGFDEILTVGFNVALAARLGVNMSAATDTEIVFEAAPSQDKEVKASIHSQGDISLQTPCQPLVLDDNETQNNTSDTASKSIICLIGYKGDPDRRIGLLGAFPSGTSSSQILNKINQEFTNKIEAILNFSSQEDNHSGILHQIQAFTKQNAKDKYQPNSHSLLSLLSDLNSKPNRNKTITCLAIMNAFHPAEIDRVLSAARKYHLATSATQVLYLTGEARLPGIEYALRQGLKVVCVGHRACEEWGIRHLAGRVREAFPGLDVEEILEEEEARPFNGQRWREDESRRGKAMKTSEGRQDDTRNAGSSKKM